MSYAAQITLMGLMVTAFFSVELWAAVLVIRRREPISVIKDMNAEIAAMSTRLRASEARQEASHQQILRLESLVTELDRGIKVLLQQLARLNETPDYTRISPPLAEVVSAAAVDALAARDKATLQRKMARRFSMAELSDLALELGIEDGVLTGDTTSERAKAIIQYMARREQMDKLVELCERERPSESW